MKCKALICLLALTVAACGGAREANAPVAANCDKVHTEAIAFTAPDAQDVLETRAIGQTCAEAIVVLTVRKASGEPIWAHAAARAWLPRLDAQDETAMSHALDRFLESWNARVDTTAALPDWPQREHVFTDQLGAFERSPFDRDGYLEIRAKALPRLCYATGIESGECIYFDAATGQVAKVYESGVD